MISTYVAPKLCVFGPAGSKPCVFGPFVSKMCGFGPYLSKTEFLKYIEKNKREIEWGAKWNIS